MTLPRTILYFRPWYRVKNPEFLDNFKFVMLRTSNNVKYTLGGLSTQASMDTFVDVSIVIHIQNTY